MAKTDFTGLSAEIEGYRERKIKQLKDLVQNSITKVEILATRDAPNFITIDKKFSKNGLSGEVGVMGSNEMAAYIEFGTGLSARDILSKYPQWVRDIAMKFYVNGQGTLQGKPYLYNNLLAVTAEFENQVNIILKSK
ncbi:hypothetical protein ACR79B_20745 [Sphingobacterium spiritivorum]|uniref:hypothetical protein n=1 Tax=Sphingobacterium spiritivorum TaxID=258 RepID=UPI003DA486D5